MKCIIDANVPIIAGRASEANVDELDCALECANFINDFIHSKNSKLVLDEDWEILAEYRNNISNMGQPTLSNLFMDWVFSYINRIESIDYLHLNKNGTNNYDDFPNDERLRSFDPADKKYIALACLHNTHPIIIQGTDCKWWNYKDVFREFGVNINFLCEPYIIRHL